MTTAPTTASTEGVAARRFALEVLARVEDDGAYANLALSSMLDRSGLVDHDRGFATDLVYGTLRHQRSCDYLVDRFLTSAPPGPARRALRLGAYQIAFRDDIPAYAAVASTVESTPKRFRGLVNAILRKVSTAPVVYPDEGTRLSYPDWIVEQLGRDLGTDAAAAALAAMNEPARATTRSDGYTQDLASQWVASLAEVAPGDVVIDLCAAPGGKATGMAATAADGAPHEASAFVVAADLQAQRVGLIAQNVERLGATSVAPLVADALAPPFRPGSADVVLLDAPCSGLGVLRRRPDARWRLDPTAPERLGALQRQLVDAAVPLVAPGGTFVYSVCTLTAVESVEIDEHIARAHPQLEPLDPPGHPWSPLGRGAVLLPQVESTDGMCIFRYRCSGG